jgi:DNA-binding beta-propeller fold protein YncE
MDRRAFLGLAAAAVLLHPARAAARVRPVALATCDVDARLAVVDLTAGRVLGWIECLPDPRSAERLPGGDALVCHTGAGAVSIVDGRSHSVRRVVRDFEEPRYTAAHPDGRYAFVTDSGSREVVSVELARGRTRGRARLPEWARHVTIDPAGTTLWVGLGSASERVALVDVRRPELPRLVRTFRPPFLAHDVGFEPAGRRVWVTSGDRRELAVYDRRHGLIRRLAAGSPPQHVAFGGGAAWVTSGVDGTCSALSLGDGRPLGAAAVPVGSYNVQAGAGLVLTPSLESGTLSVLDRRGTLWQRVRVASSSHDACLLG